MEFYCDARLGKRPHVGFVCMMNAHSSFIVSESKAITNIVPLSPLDCESYIVCRVTQVILYLRIIFSILGSPITKPTVIYCDNKSTVDMCYDITKTGVSRYFIHRLGFIKKAIADSKIEVLHVKGERNWETS